MTFSKYNKFKIILNNFDNELKYKVYIRYFYI